MRAVSDATAKLIAWIEDEIRWPGPSKTEVIVAALEKERQPEALVAPPPSLLPRTPRAPAPGA